MTVVRRVDIPAGGIQEDKDLPDGYAEWDPAERFANPNAYEAPGAPVVRLALPAYRAECLVYVLDLFDRTAELLSISPDFVPTGWGDVRGAMLEVLRLVAAADGFDPYYYRDPGPEPEPEPAAPAAPGLATGTVLYDPEQGVHYTVVRTTEGEPTLRAARIGEL